MNQNDKADSDSIFQRKNNVEQQNDATYCEYSIT